MTQKMSQAGGAENFSFVYIHMSRDFSPSLKHMLKGPEGGKALTQIWIREDMEMVAGF
jgi:hypothetical protein